MGRWKTGCINKTPFSWRFIAEPVHPVQAAHPRNSWNPKFQEIHYDSVYEWNTTVRYGDHRVRFQVFLLVAYIYLQKSCCCQEFKKKKKKEEKSGNNAVTKFPFSSLPHETIIIRFQTINAASSSFLQKAKYLKPSQCVHPEFNHLIAPFLVTTWYPIHTVNG